MAAPLADGPMFSIKSVKSLPVTEPS